MKSKCASTITEPHFALTVKRFNKEGTSWCCIRALRKPLVRCIPKQHHQNLQQLRWLAIRQADRKMGGPLHVLWAGRKNTVSQLALDAVEKIPLVHELDDSPRRDELVNAIRILSQGKYPGKDWLISAEVIKAEATLSQNHCTSCCVSAGMKNLFRKRWEIHILQEQERQNREPLFARKHCNRVCRSYFALLSRERKCLQCRKTTCRS